MTNAPVRGTQSFVGLMAAVFKRPSLTGLEVAWRWSTGVILLLVAVAATRMHPLSAPDDTYLLQNLSLFQPATAVNNLMAVASGVLAGVSPLLRWFLPFAIAVWLACGALGRTMVLRRYDGALHRRPAALFLLGIVRACSLIIVWLAWAWSMGGFLRWSILGPAVRNEEPKLILFAALAICGSLAVYVFWGLMSWILQLAPILAMRLDVGPLKALRRAFDADGVRGKLVEVNLVMSIVKIILIILAMVFSACPLPFATVETQEFLTCWWVAVGVLYLLASDYFHVVRAAVYVELWRACEGTQSRFLSADGAS